MKRLDLPKILNEKGKKLGDGMVAAGQKYGFDLHVTGMPSLFYLRLADDPSLMLHQEWIAECVKRGIFFTTHHNHFINYALSDEDIAETIAVADEKNTDHGLQGVTLAEHRKGLVGDLDGLGDILVGEGVVD